MGRTSGGSMTINNHIQTIETDANSLAAKVSGEIAWALRGA
jgi:hypothetical protein